MSVHLFGDSDDFEKGFTLGVVWQLLREELDHASVVLPASLTSRAARLAEARGYRTTIRKPHGLPGLRYLKFKSVKGAGL
jgi:hypothetical protein